MYNKKKENKLDVKNEVGDECRKQGRESKCLNETDGHVDR